MSYQGVYYSEYLALDKILDAQHLESDKLNAHAHDEMLFIVTHQAYELWFKQVLYEVESALEVLAKPTIEDNEPDLYTVNHRLKRVVKILEVLIAQLGIMETMTALDFLDFRDMLRPASGFQSMQFKLLESSLGLKMAERFGKEYYISQLKPEDAAKILEHDKKPSLIHEVNNWLERMPFFDEPKYWKTTSDDFWKTYVDTYASTLSEREQGNVAMMQEKLFSPEKKEGWKLSAKARRSALFIFLYRDYPLLQLPFGFLNSLLEIDECLATWRYRHINMVHRIIGMRTGTGGSTGKDYLKGAMENHYIFSEIADLSSFLVNRQKLPVLEKSLQQKLGFEKN